MDCELVIIFIRQWFFLSFLFNDEAILVFSLLLSAFGQKKGVVLWLRMSYLNKNFKNGCGKRVALIKCTWMGNTIHDNVQTISVSPSPCDCTSFLHSQCHGNDADALKT